jgi:predicted phosphodiesterase
MAVLIVADVHANLSALEAVIAAATARAPVEAIWALGDLVGYGPQPAECLALLRSYRHLAVGGNHDFAAAGVIGAEDFNPVARTAIEWTADVLGEEDKRYLRELPLVVTEGDFTLVHGSLRDPVWDYLIHGLDAEEQLARQTTAFSLVGHSHLPLVYFEAGASVKGGPIGEGAVLPLTPRRFVANPGGLGQPRDGDPRAPYAVLDAEAGTLSFHRAAYDIAATQWRMRAAGLPRPLIDRLARGR